MPPVLWMTHLSIASFLEVFGNMCQVFMHDSCNMTAFITSCPPACWFADPLQKKQHAMQDSMLLFGFAALNVQPTYHTNQQMSHAVHLSEAVIGNATDQWGWYAWRKGGGGGVWGTPQGDSTHIGCTASDRSESAAVQPAGRQRHNTNREKRLSCSAHTIGLIWEAMGKLLGNTICKGNNWLSPRSCQHMTMHLT